MTGINASHNILFMDILHIFYPPLRVISNTDALLLKFVHISLCCKFDQQATATFGFKKVGGQTITNYCTEISKREKHKFDHFSLKAAEGQKEYLKI